MPVERSGPTPTAFCTAAVPAGPSGGSGSGGEMLLQRNVCTMWSQNVRRLAVEVARQF